RLGALLVREPAPAPATFYNMGCNCVAFLYVTRDGYDATPNALLAMAQQYHVTTVDYVNTLVELLRGKSEMTPADFPPPAVAAPASPHLPVEEYRQPSTAFYSANEFLAASPSPSRPLHQYTFIVPDAQLKKKYEALLHFCGATVVHMSPDNAAMIHTYVPEMKTVALASDEIFSALVVALGKEPHPNTIDHKNDGSSKTEQHRSDSRCPSHETELLEAAYTTFYLNGVCVIPEKNIQRAIFTGFASEINGRPSSRCLVSSKDTVQEERKSDENREASPAITPGRAASVALSVKQPSPSPALSGCEETTTMRRELSKPLTEVEKNSTRQPSCSKQLCDATHEELAALHGDTNSHRASQGKLEVKRGQQSALLPLRQKQQNEPNTKDAHSSKASAVTRHVDPAAEKRKSGSKSPSVEQSSAVFVALEKRPVVAHTPSQVNAPSMSGTSPHLQRVVAHKITRRPSPAASPAALESERRQASSSVVSSSSYTASRPPSAESLVVPHLEGLGGAQQQKQRR
ncbi:putative recombination initiation protein NBS1, partial [Trypanosoma grayi]|uniref:putative recombination initiation protein NBS1 n=1 Tax=Trypanosoma grayi TaxID=71804 RepID=UPI0004F43507